MRFAPALALTGSLAAAAIAVPAYAQQTDDFNRTGGYYAPGGRTAATQDLEPDRQFMRSGRYYGALSVGVTFPDDIELEDFNSNTIELDEGYAISGAIGVYLDWFRLEGEIAYRRNDMDTFDISGFGDDLDSGDITTLAFMGNAFYDIRLNNRTDLYLGGGLGAANIDGTLKTNNVGRADGDDWVFAWQLMAGIAYQLRENLDLTFGYRYFDTEDFDFDDEASFEAAAIHSVEVGLRFTF